MCSKDADRTANSADLDQTAPSDLGLPLIAQTCLSEYVGSKNTVNFLIFADINFLYIALGQ